MLVRTSCEIDATAEAIWPLLCNSRMEASRSCLFGLGVPQPEQCRLPGGSGGVGSTRQCISDRGVIEQEILDWDEPRQLSFKMQQTDMYFKDYVREIVETFELTPGDYLQTKLTRTTHVSIRGRLKLLKQVLFFIGLKKVHRFVFRNWRRICAHEAAS